MAHIREPYFDHLDVFERLLEQIESDDVVGDSSFSTTKDDALGHRKSVHLIASIYAHLIDAHAMRSNTTLRIQLLVWFFARLMRTFLALVDACIHDGILLDTRCAELGFRRNAACGVDHVDFWHAGFTQFSSILAQPPATSKQQQQQHTQLPHFLRIVLTYAFKICKHMEIIGDRLPPRDHAARIADRFLEALHNVCPYLKPNLGSGENGVRTERLTELTPTAAAAAKKAESVDLLQLNFAQLLRLSKSDMVDETTRDSGMVSIDELFDNTASKTSQQQPVMLSEMLIESTVNESLLDYASVCSHILVQRLVVDNRLVEFVEFVHAHFLFKSSEVMFLFGKRLFDAISAGEPYQEDAILNSMFYQAASSVFTTAALSKRAAFTSSMITLRYEASAASSSQSHSRATAEISSRLAHSVAMGVQLKWPLSTVIKEASILQYSHIFAFILRMKQVKYDMDSLDLRGFCFCCFPLLKVLACFCFLFYIWFVCLYLLRMKDMDISRHNTKKESKFDVTTLNVLFRLRFKLMNYANSLHNTICNQVNKEQLYSVLLLFLE